MTAMSTNRIGTAPDALALRVRAHIQGIAGQATPITYKALAKALDVTPPNTIRQVTEALERLMQEDAANGRPFIAALVISKARGGLPAPGFFDCARRLGRFHCDPSGPEARTIYTAEFHAAVAFWSAAAEADGG